MILRKLASIHSECCRPKVNMFTPRKDKLHFHWKPFFYKTPIGLCQLCLWKGIKTKNSSSAHVWYCKVGLKHRMMISLISVDRYNSNEACKHTYRVLGIVHFQKMWILSFDRHFNDFVQRLVEKIFVKNTHSRNIFVPVFTRESVF